MLWNRSRAGRVRTSWGRLAPWLVVAAIIGCGSDDASVSSAEGSRVTTRPIEKVQEDHTAALMRIPGVVGTAIGALEDGTAYIAVFVKERTPELDAEIPDQLEGYPVRVRVSGEFRPLNDAR